jgi:hypothetical protein
VGEIREAEVLAPISEAAKWIGLLAVSEDLSGLFSLTLPAEGYNFVLTPWLRISPPEADRLKENNSLTHGQVRDRFGFNWMILHECTMRPGA